MSKLNSTLLVWQAPTLNVDGSPIDYELAYELEVEGTVVATFPGRLNPQGRYEQDVAEVFDNVTNASYDVRLRALRVDMPAEKSDWSNLVTYRFDKRRPKPPFLLDS